MAYLQDIQMFFMSFSRCYFSGFSLVWYHEKFINKAMKTPLYHEITVQKPWLKFGVDFKFFCFMMMKILWIQQHKFKKNFVGFPWRYKKLRVMKNVWFPLNSKLLMVHGNVVSKFMDFSLRCNDPWTFMLIRWKSFYQERGEACTLDENL